MTDPTAASSGLPDAHRSLVLCVDLDGTLVKTDTLLEALLAVALRRPLALAEILRRSRDGRPALKKAVASVMPVDPAALPYNEELLAYLRAERARGRRLALATASTASTAAAVSAHLGLFSDVHASEDLNLKGANKAAHLVKQYGRRQFAYAGDSAHDQPVFREAGAAVLVSTGPDLERNLDPSVRIEHRIVARTPRSLWAGLGAALRPHQWVKNLLLLVPLVAAHRYPDMQTVTLLLLAFVSMSAIASAFYVFNDMADVAADRRHPTKRMRPFASGAVPIQAGLALVPLLTLVGFLLASLLPIPFILGLGAYTVLTVSYSLWAKRRPGLDVVFLAALYTLRIILGGAAIGVPVSNWLLGFSMCFFLGLALLKRYGELKGLPVGGGKNARRYSDVHLGRTFAWGVAATAAAVLVLAIYIHTGVVYALYDQPAWLLGVCAVLSLWAFRVWKTAMRGELHDDPVRYAVRDWSTYAGALATGAFMYLATR